MGHIEATFYSAFCLCFYWACRALSPLFGGGDKVFKIYFWVTCHDHRWHLGCILLKMPAI